MPQPQNPKPAPAPLWEPLKNLEFRLLYIGLSITQVGGWMNGIGCSWLMTSLDGSALMLGLVQTSFMLPGILLSLPAGVLADQTDRRRLILILSSIMIIVSIDLAVLSALGWVGPWLLLAHTLAMGSIFAMQGPALLSIIQDIVRRDLLPQALTLNSISLNLGRSIGPVIAGILISTFGAAVVFFVNSVGYAALGSVFVGNRRADLRAHARETFMIALLNGLRFAVNERRLRGMLIRLLLFLCCASALLAPCCTVCMLEHLTVELGEPSSGDSGAVFEIFTADALGDVLGALAGLGEGVGQSAEQEGGCGEAAPISCGHLWVLPRG